MSQVQPRQVLGLAFDHRATDCPRHGKTMTRWNGQCVMELLCWRMCIARGSPISGDLDGVTAHFTFWPVVNERHGFNIR
jgi:hypothetical protein